MAVKIPVRPKRAFQRLRAVLDGREYVFRFRFNQRINRWSFDLLTVDEEPLAAGVPIAVNRPLLVRWQHDNRLPQGALMAIDADQRDPDFESFGTSTQMVYLTVVEAQQALQFTPEELAALFPSGDAS